MSTVTVNKKDHLGDPIISYKAEVISRGDTWICVQAVFAHRDVDIGVMKFRQGDLMTEWFYTNRYYNIFEIQDASSHKIKGWYCNITRPAQITGDNISADDLALDVYISPSGVVMLLDEDDFATLDLPASERQAALRAVEALIENARQRVPPFDAIVPSP